MLKIGNREWRGQVIRADRNTLEGSQLGNGNTRHQTHDREWVLIYIRLSIHNMRDQGGVQVVYTYTALKTKILTSEDHNYPSAKDLQSTAVQKDWEKVLLRREYMKSFRDVEKDPNGIPSVHEVMSESEIK